MVRTPMRIAFTIPLLILVAMPGLAHADPATINPSAAAAEDRTKAEWADREAQSRIVEGDYDGAVQAEQQADNDRRQADQQDRLARTPKR
jgi:hypothetical protein